MSHAFAKDSRACAACISWGGERALSEDNTLVHVARYSVEGECRTASSHDYRKITKGYHTCTAWAALPMLKKHGGLPERQLAERQSAFATAPAPAMARPEPAPPPAPKPVAPPSPPAEAEPIACRADPLDLDKVPPQARILHTHWLRLRQKRGVLPRPQDIDTAQIRECVSRLCLLEPVPGAPDFTYRACGRSLQRRLGARPIARRVSECHPADAAQRLLRDLDACLAAGEPLAFLVQGDPIQPGARFVDLLLPLADDQGRPAMLLAYRHVPGG
jgi:hypothetical protein